MAGFDGRSVRAFFALDIYKILNLLKDGVLISFADISPWKRPLF